MMRIDGVMVRQRRQQLRDGVVGGTLVATVAALLLALFLFG
jgi:hypothetical protein